jgi:hypothetical protein
VAIHTAILDWNNATIPKLGQAIYNHRRFSDMPILADALEDAGCHDADILNHCRQKDANILDHCRQPGNHARGCWILDLVRGKK